MAALDVISGLLPWSVDCRDVMSWLQSLPAHVAHCCITSPPYFGLRSYLKDGNPDKVNEIGSERTPEEFIAKMVAVFSEVRRVLRDDGVLFLNLGDSYCDDTKWGGKTGGKHVKGLHGEAIGRARSKTGAKPGDLLNMPHRVASALQSDGWYWRQTIIWSKRSPMPESVSGWRWIRCRVKVGIGINSDEPSKVQTGGRAHSHRSENGKDFDRQTKWQPCPGCPKCIPNDGWILRRGRWRHTTAHEYVFMLTPNERYFCDGEAVKEAANKPQGSNGDFGNKDAGARLVKTLTGNMAPGVKYETDGSRNPRSVLTLSSESYKGSHFATFPSALVKPFIDAATSSAGCCVKCGACYAPMVESERVPTRPGLANKIWKHANGDDIGQRSQASPNLDPQRHLEISSVLGYRPTCACKNPSPPRPCIVLEPFAGSGTTLQVAKHMGRRAIGCELNAEYLPLIEKRVAEVPRCLVTKKNKPKTRKPKPEVLPLFDI